MKCFLAVMMVLVLVPGIAGAATIHGSVYDLSLEKAAGVAVSIDTAPRQQAVSGDGDYSFTVGPGEYTLAAQQLDEGRVTASAEESVVVEADGEYVIDLILFPSFDEEESLVSGIGGMSVEELSFTGQADYTLFVLGGIVVIVIILVMILMKVARLKPVKEERLPEDLEKAVEYIRKSGGRVNQKDLRKEMGMSEAKISLMVAELEHRGIARKIKKGRGNIVVLANK
jgi:uncharacterized membrane protein